MVSLNSVFFFVAAEMVFSCEIWCPFLELRVPLDMWAVLCGFKFLLSLVVEGAVAV
jgi:hypothetical protein